MLSKALRYKIEERSNALHTRSSKIKSKSKAKKRKEKKNSAGLNMAKFFKIVF